MEFPDGPVTETHAPQLPELSQLESESAVPRMFDGRVYVEKEQAPPATFPPYRRSVLLVIERYIRSSYIEGCLSGETSLAQHCTVGQRQEGRSKKSR